MQRLKVNDQLENPDGPLGGYSRVVQVFERNPVSMWYMDNVSFGGVERLTQNC